MWAAQSPLLFCHLPRLLGCCGNNRLFFHIFLRTQRRQIKRASCHQHLEGSGSWTWCWTVLRSSVNKVTPGSTVVSGVDGEFIGLVSSPFSVFSCYVAPISKIFAASYSIEFCDNSIFPVVKYFFKMVRSEDYSIINSTKKYKQKIDCD